MQKSQGTQAILPVGTVIRGRYHIQSIIGQGSSGAVYLVHDSHEKHGRNTTFALKEVSGLTPQEIMQFAFSGVMLYKLHHPSFAHIIDIPKDEKQERVYLLMEYIEGPDLETLCQQQRGQRFSWAEVKSIMSPIIDAVEYLHTQQPPVAHRDIKPINIIMAENGKKATLVDFGIVRGQRTSFEMDEIFSTYRAPEVYTNTSDTRADIYGLGATCYMLLTGVMPAPSLVRQAQIEGGNSDPLRPVNQLIPMIPQSVVQAIQKAMSLEPANRFATVKQFWAAMYALETKLPVQLSQLAPPVGKKAVEAQKLVASQKAAEAQQPVASQKAVETSHAKPKEPASSPSSLSVKRAIIPLVAAMLLISLLSLGLNLNSLPFIGHHATSSKSTTPIVSTHIARTTSVPTTPSGTTPSTGITGLYAGTIYNIVSNVSTTVAVNIQQMQGLLYGNVVLGPKMQGGGSFTGTIDTSKHLQLLVTNAAGQETMLLQGSLQSSTSLSGEYYSCEPPLSTTCTHSTTNYGLWNTVLMNHQ